MPIQRRRSLRGINRAFAANNKLYEQENNSSASTAIRHNVDRTISFSTTDEQEQPLRVRNDNVFSQRPYTPLSQYSRSLKTKRSFSGFSFNSRKSEPTVQRRDLPPLDDPNIHVAVADSIRLAKKRIPTNNDPESHRQMEAGNTRSESTLHKHAFQRWVKTLHRRNVRKQSQTLQPRDIRWSLDEFDEDPVSWKDDGATPGPRRHRKSSSWASSAFVTTMKSVTASLATGSVIASKSHRRSKMKRSSNRSSRLSRSFNRNSSDDNSARLIDKASMERAVKRRQTLDELVNSEESYVADLKVLVDVYRAIGMRTPGMNVHKAIRNINEILDLHEALLLLLRPVVAVPIPRPNLSVSRNDKPERPRQMHVRSQSVDEPALQHPRHSKSAMINARLSLDASRTRTYQDSGPISFPDDAAQIARAFESSISHFFVYEEYGSRYESMLHDITLASKTPNFETYQKGLEALANTIAPISLQSEGRRKALTYGDLLIKPIQRICRYPLLFADILKQTPVIDCPESHAEVEKVLCRLRETVNEINKATNDPYTHEKIQRTWRLQDLLSFPDPNCAPFSLRSLGHPILCGCLHVAYRTRNSVAGEYMLCALFKTCLILAVTPRANEHRKTSDIVACISLSELEIVACDHGRGLQCHTAPFSWKVIFEADQSFHEIIFSACNIHEEAVWKQTITSLAAEENNIIFEDIPRSPYQYSYLSLTPPIRSIGPALGLPGTVARRISIRRASTLGKGSELFQVVIKNTHALKDGHNPSTNTVGRSQSVHPIARVPVLAPKRAERVRIEQDMVDVWTKEHLSYPGMNSRPDFFLRHSASSVMRRLSKASKATASSFSKRSTSFSSITNEKFDDTTEEDEKFGYPCAPVTHVDSGLLTVDESPTSSGGYAHNFYPIVSHLQTSQASQMSRDSSAYQSEYSVPSGSRMSKRSLESMKEKEGKYPISPLRPLRSRFSAPLSLIKTISTDGMKALFG